MAPTPVRQWIVTTPRGRQSTFESDSAAFTSALVESEAQAPSIIREPEGNRYAVFRLDARVELSTMRLLGGTTRQVVDTR